jgi:hypothetical protein
VSQYFGLIIESLVSVLLLLTISFCMVLNRRLKKLKADEHALKATISELITATEIAERAIAGLKLTVRDCDQSLGDRLAAGEQLARELSRQIDSSKDVLSRLTQITIAARPAPQPVPMPPAASIDPPPPAQPDPRATAAAASAFAARARQRSAAA